VAGGDGGIPVEDWEVPPRVAVAVVAVVPPPWVVGLLLFLAAMMDV
jgi:hypothetical protein